MITSTSAITSVSTFIIVVVFIRFLFVVGLVLLVIASVDRRNAGGCVLTRLVKRLLLVRLFDIRALTHATAFVLGRLVCISNTFALIVGCCLIRFFVHSSIVSLRSEILRYTNLRAPFANFLFSWSLRFSGIIFTRLVGLALTRRIANTTRVVDSSVRR